MSDRKFTDPDQRNIRQEKLLFEFVKDCKYEHNKAYFLGAKALWSLFGETKILPEDKIAKYSPLFNNPEDLTLSDSELENIYTLLSERMNKIKEKQIKLESEPEELIRVWDIGYSDYLMIPKSQFNPVVHRLVR